MSTRLGTRKTWIPDSALPPAGWMTSGKSLHQPGLSFLYFLLSLKFPSVTSFVDCPADNRGSVSISFSFFYAFNKVPSTFYPIGHLDLHSFNTTVSVLVKMGTKMCPGALEPVLRGRVGTFQVDKQGGSSRMTETLPPKHTALREGNLPRSLEREKRAVGSRSRRREGRALGRACGRKALNATPERLPGSGRE